MIYSVTRSKPRPYEVLSPNSDTALFMGGVTEIAWHHPQEGESGYSPTATVYVKVGDELTAVSDKIPAHEAKADVLVKESHVTPETDRIEYVVVPDKAE